MNVSLINSVNINLDQTDSYKDNLFSINLNDSSVQNNRKCKLSPESITKL